MNSNDWQKEIVKWTLKEFPIKSLKVHPKNPRQMKKKQFQRLSDLIAKFGLIDKPIINADMTIIGGHQRIRYLKNKKIKVVDCWISDRILDEKEVDELMIGMNLHQGAWDWDKMANEWDPLDLLDYGFSEQQLLDSSEELEKILDESEQKKKKKKTCPHCGNEL